MQLFSSLLWQVAPCSSNNNLYSNCCFLCVHFFNIVYICVSLFCRGFGFVTFTDAASVDKVLAQQHHELDSKTVSWFYAHIHKCSLFCGLFTVLH